MNNQAFCGIWENEFGSVMDLKVISDDDNVVHFGGTYTSHTGETGIYTVTGIADANPTDVSQVISFNVLWKNLDAPGGDDTSRFSHAVSSFTGQFQSIDGNEVMTTTYMLVQNTSPDLDWGSTSVDKSTFRRVVELIHPLKVYDKQDNNAVELTLQRGPLSNNGATRWVAEFAIGSPSQSLKWMIDTGTTHTWITSTACNSHACLQHDRFDASQSETFERLHERPQEISFGPWGSMEAQLGRDVFRFSEDTGDNTEVRQNFYLAEHYQGSKFEDLNADGGLSIPALLPDEIDSSEVLPLLRNNLKISHPIASFCYDSETGEGSVLLGAIDLTAFDQKTFTVCPLIDNDALIKLDLNYLWTIQLDSLSLERKGQPNTVLSEYAFSLDTGSSFFKGSETVISTIVDAITNNGELPSKSNTKPPFELYPLLNLGIQQQTFSLKPEQYFVQLEDGSWRLAFQVLDGLPEGFLLAGTLFLEYIYTVFFYQTRSNTQKAIGLAKRG